MKRSILIYFCFLSTVTFCQKGRSTSDMEYGITMLSREKRSLSIRLTSDIGYSVTKLSKEKRIGLYKGIGLGIEKYISNNWYLDLLPGIYSIQFSALNSIGQNTFTSFRFIDLNIEAKKYLPITVKSGIYLAFGLYGSDVFKKKVENNTLWTEETQKNLGYNFGLSSVVGLRTTLTRIISFDIGIAGKNDYLFSYDRQVDKVNNSGQSLKISFCLQF